MNDEQRGFVVSELVGRTILLQYVGAQVPDTEAINQMAEDPKVIFTAPTRVFKNYKVCTKIAKGYTHTST